MWDGADQTLEVGFKLSVARRRDEDTETAGGQDQGWDPRGGAGSGGKEIHCLTQCVEPPGGFPRLGLQSDTQKFPDVSPWLAKLKLDSRSAGPEFEIQLVVWLVLCCFGKVTSGFGTTASASGKRGRENIDPDLGGCSMIKRSSTCGNTRLR